MPARRAPSWQPALLLVASALLAACASGPRRPRRPRREELRLDTETAHRLRHAALLGKGASALASGAARAMGSNLAELVPDLLGVLGSEGAVGELEERLWECARQAERKVNGRYFGNRAPTRAECGEEVNVDGCGERITRAMLLGQQKHVLALQCAREVLEELWPAPFSVEQRYRYYPNARLLETVSRQEEARLIKEGCTKELWRTIKPDLVLHADGDLLRSVLTLDFKFPCPNTNEPRWTRYGESSAYANANQGEVYEDALGGKPFLLSPGLGVAP
ncbi:hypothetical protein [Pyxidicoccus sp. MSG2]|uniref:hypothetical protein n=1 Tax=Pyxidicoccus sp. MSG2 TaxID=2996790 RepID=UPI0022706FC9|nr:hypothetical protein [Pyxidicoccus sp. MSG2]MCY1019693.1 hypothetical protein [Pyxidicoccus sp. MSG2]